MIRIILACLVLAGCVTKDLPPLDDLDSQDRRDWVPPIDKTTRAYRLALLTKARLCREGVAQSHDARGLAAGGPKTPAAPAAVSGRDGVLPAGEGREGFFFFGCER